MCVTLGPAVQTCRFPPVKALLLFLCVRACEEKCLVQLAAKGKPPPNPRPESPPTGGASQSKRGTTGADCYACFTMLLRFQNPL